jgi:hypothetical protein
VIDGWWSSLDPIGLMGRRCRATVLVSRFITASTVRTAAT